jgi:phage baseplate assembly protein W
MEHSDPIGRLVGTGWRFPIGVDRRGRIAVATYADEIEQAMHIILSTAPGERVMRPEFGCRIHELLFAPINVSTMTAASHYVRDALARWEPRVEIQDVTVEPGHVDYRRAPDPIHSFLLPEAGNGARSPDGNGAQPATGNGSHPVAVQELPPPFGVMQPLGYAQAERVEADPSAPSLLLINIIYRIRATHDERALVYPFYTIPDEM